MFVPKQDSDSISTTYFLSPGHHPQPGLCPSQASNSGFPLEQQALLGSHQGTDKTFGRKETKLLGPEKMNPQVLHGTNELGIEHSPLTTWMGPPPSQPHPEKPNVQLLIPPTICSEILPGTCSSSPGAEQLGKGGTAPALG